MALSSSASTNLATDTSLRRASLLREGIAVALVEFGLEYRRDVGGVLVVPTGGRGKELYSRCSDGQLLRNAKLATGFRWSTRVRMVVVDCDTQGSGQLRRVEKGTKLWRVAGHSTRKLEGAIASTRPKL